MTAYPSSLWKNLDEELPKIGQRVIVAAWEFGCMPRYFIVYFWQSSLPGQPPNFSFDETYRAPIPCILGEVVHFWMPIPKLPEVPQ